MIDILASAGICVGKLVQININDIDPTKREFIVLGKDNKGRKAYFDTRSKLQHISQYISSRTDNNKSLFVSLNNLHNRLTIRDVEE